MHQTLDMGFSWGISNYFYGTIFGCFFIVTLMLGWYDFKYFRLPNRLNGFTWIFGVIAFILASTVCGSIGQLVRILSASCLVFIAYWLVVYLSNNRMGYGDVKLAAALAVYTGWIGWDCLWYANYIAWILGGVWAVFLLMSKNLDKKIPFGCCLIAGSYGSIIASFII